MGSALKGRYDLEREIAGGGMGVVFAARAVGTAQAVAVKVLRPEIARIVGPERFLREITILRRLAHPHIVPLLDAGAAGGLPYLVMPYVPGPTLRDRIAGAPAGLPIDEMRAVARDVAAALDYAHAAGVVHRDIKPENILLPAAGGAVVTDFGLARAVEVAGGDAISSSGLELGTPAYTSPEQASGTCLVDGRADIYALGCVLYEMLAGEPPFGGPTARAILARHAAEPPRSLRIVRKDVPGAVERAIQAALAKTPATRPASGAALAALLEASTP